jgi:hypothetical protein
MQMRLRKCEPIWVSSSQMSLGLAVLTAGTAVVGAEGAGFAATVDAAGAGELAAGTAARVTAAGSVSAPAEGLRHKASSQAADTDRARTGFDGFIEGSSRPGLVAVELLKH